MACFNPILAVDNGINFDTGKHIIKILPQRSDFNFAMARSRYGSSLMMLPCGHCVACAQDYARMWQARIMCESLYYEKSCFLTLTYKKAPEKPSTEDLRQFIKELRNYFGKGIKFFGCGEKGEINQRAHYHLIVFGVDFSEDRYISDKRGTNYVFRSPLLETLWDKGFSSIGSLDIESAGYVAQYCDKKKIKGLDNGEFVIMSRGLGKRYFEEHYIDIFSSDFLYFNGNKFRIPRYFLKLALNKDDFYLRCLVDDYSQRKKITATNFRYNSNKGFSVEEEAMFDDKSIKTEKMLSKEALRDVY